MKKAILLSVGALLLLGSCSNEENERTDSGSATLKIASATLGQSFTRADDALTSGTIGICLKGSDTYTAQDNVAYTYTSGGGWASETAVYVSPTDATLAAYYPYSSTQGGSGTVSLSSGIYTETSDLCYAHTTLNSTSPAWSITLEHACALVTLNITRKSDYPGAGTLSEVILLGEEGLNSSGNLNLFSGEYTDLQQTYRIDYTPAESVILGTDASERFSFLLVPMQSLSGKMEFGLGVDGKILSTVIVPADYNLLALTAGQQYIFNLVLQGASLSLTGVSVKDWTEVTVPGTNVVAPSIN